MLVFFYFFFFRLLNNYEINLHVGRYLYLHYIDAMKTLKKRYQLDNLFILKFKLSNALNRAQSIDTFSPLVHLEFFLFF